MLVSISFIWNKYVFADLLTIRSRLNNNKNKIKRILLHRLPVLTENFMG